jgi:hypothetical protein
LGTLPKLTTTASIAALQAIIFICTPGGVAAGIFTLFYLTISVFFPVLTLFFGDSTSTLMSALPVLSFIPESGFFFFVLILLFLAWGALKIYITKLLMSLVSGEQ